MDYDKDTGELLTASSVLEIDEAKLREEEALDGYYVLITSEMDETDDKIIDMYRGPVSYTHLDVYKRQQCG